MRLSDVAVERDDAIVRALEAAAERHAERLTHVADVELWVADRVRTLDLLPYRAGASSVQVVETEQTVAVEVRGPDGPTSYVQERGMEGLRNVLAVVDGITAGAGHVLRGPGRREWEVRDPYGSGAPIVVTVHTDLLPRRRWRRRAVCEPLPDWTDLASDPWETPLYRAAVARAGSPDPTCWAAVLARAVAWYDAGVVRELVLEHPGRVRVVGAPRWARRPLQVTLGAGLDDDLDGLVPRPGDVGRASHARATAAQVALLLDEPRRGAGWQVPTDVPLVVRPTLE